jgi:4-hydroxythreonine-4-phosphate dehydrogenase
MKVYVTQGHEQGIGLEVFFKSCLVSTQRDLDHVSLLAYETSIAATLKSMRIPFKVTSNHLEFGGQVLNLGLLTNVNFSQSFSALELGMRLSEAGGVLFTLPTSKDQFPIGAGHTEYFRKFYNRPELGMFFSSPRHQVLLLTDHVPISALSKELTSKLIEERIETALNTLEAWQWPIKRLLVAGFNPHAGEGGLIGNEDERVTVSLNRLRAKFQIEMSGPIPGDTMLLEQRSPDDLLVYVYHDQGLAAFKGTQGFVGSNITLGLPYPRVSPDHGTSFKLYGKNAADYRGCAFALKEALKLLKRTIYGKDPSHKGKGPQS